MRRRKEYPATWDSFTNEEKTEYHRKALFDSLKKEGLLDILNHDGVISTQEEKKN